jgi:hypothetical protein
VGYQIDVSRHPLVVITFVGATSEDDFDRYLEEMQRLVLSRRERNVTIIDGSRSERTTPLQRRKQADWMRTNDDMLRRYSLGTAFVISSPVVRGVLTAILWVSPMSAPHTVVATYEEAERWANAQLNAVGLAAP